MSENKTCSEYWCCELKVSLLNDTVGCVIRDVRHFIAYNAGNR